MFDFFMLTPTEVAEVWFGAQVCGVIAVAGIIGAILRPEEW